MKIKIFSTIFSWGRPDFLVVHENRVRSYFKGTANQVLLAGFQRSVHLHHSSDAGRRGDGFQFRDHVLRLFDSVGKENSGNSGNTRVIYPSFTQLGFFSVIFTRVLPEFSSQLPE